MKESTMLTLMAFLAAFFILAPSALAACSSCGKDADWSRSANEFMDWDPQGEETIAFAPKEAAMPSSQAQEKAVDYSENYSKIIALQSINATPATVKSYGTTRITAVFAINSSEGMEGETQIMAHAQIRDSAGAEVERLILVRSSAYQYFSNWVADVPPGLYRLDIGATSTEEAAMFKEALQIEVVG